MTMCQRIICIAVSVWAMAGTWSAHAQYPKVPKAVAAAAAEAQAAADKRSDEAWEKAQPAIQAWAAKGKPYIPWASKPSDLPQADIPAFPGAEGGGMYS